MLILGLACAAAFVLSFALVPAVQRLSRRIGAIDPEDRLGGKGRCVPTLGGLAIAAPVYMLIPAFALVTASFHQERIDSPYRLPGFLAGGLFIVLLGCFDDLAGATAIIKLMVQVPVAILTWTAGIRIETLCDLSGDPWTLPVVVSFLITIGWLVLAMNAFNLLDGLDGLAAGFAVQVLLALGLCAALHDQGALALLILVVAGATGGFLVHNFHPATIFMGDTGSLFLGYFIGIASIWVSAGAASPVGSLAPAMALGLPLLDTALAVARRAVRGHQIFIGDLDHLHHRLRSRGASHRGAVLSLWCASTVFTVLCMTMVMAPDSRVAVCAALAGIVIAAVLSHHLGYLRAPRVAPLPREAASDAPVR